MPKEAASIVKVRAYAAEFPTEFIVTSGKSLFCKLCSTVMCHERRSSVLNHRDCTKHTRAKDAENEPRQTLLRAEKVRKGQGFVDRVLTSFLSADIPLHKLNNPEVKSRFQFMGYNAPSECCCRSRVTSMAEKETLRIQNLLKGKNIFMVIDEVEVAGAKYINTRGQCRITRKEIPAALQAASSLSQLTGSNT